MRSVLDRSADESGGLQPAPDSPDRKVRPWCAALAVCLGLFLLGMDLTVLNVAIPSLQADLRPSMTQVQWIVDAYALALGSTVLATGPLGDRYGNRRFFVTGVAVCAAGSLAGALGTTPDQVIAARCLMGVGAALLMPATLSVVTQVFTDPLERRKGISLWAAAAGLGGLTGPVIGGWLVEHHSWRAGFWVNLPIAAAAVILALLLVPPSRRVPAKEPFDFPGMALSAAGLFALVWAVVEAPGRGWTSVPVLAATGLSTLLLAAFVLRERSARSPMVPLRFVADRAVATASASLALTSFGLFGSLFVLALYLQGSLGMSPWAAGVHLLPLAGALTVGAVLATRLVDWTSTRVTVTAGLLAVTAAFVIASRTGVASGYPRVLAFECVVGVGAGLVATAATETVMTAIPATHAGLASSLNDATRQVGSALGVAVQGSVLASVFTDHLNRDLADLPSVIGAAVRSGSPIARTLGRGAEAVPEALRHRIADAVHAAFVSGLTAAATLAAATTALAAAVAWWGLTRSGGVGVQPEAGRRHGSGQVTGVTTSGTGKGSGRG
ncbi:EmrB/QacA subfamily drug resistance transporter [Streptacidiphilus sp. MAP12-20]|uniref:MFS transporter n=1 Tax=Streptacidiphilus sp. MAP12-20 TaxID=3156299 RepID=UPI00351510AE